jgi:hypothetical protein
LAVRNGTLLGTGYIPKVRSENVYASQLPTLLSNIHISSSLLALQLFSSSALQLFTSSPLHLLTSSPSSSLNYSNSKLLNFCALQLFTSSPHHLITFLTSSPLHLFTKGNGNGQGNGQGNGNANRGKLLDVFSFSHLITSSPLHLSPLHLFTSLPLHLLTSSPSSSLNYSNSKLLNFCALQLFTSSPHHLITLSPHHLPHLFTSSPLLNSSPLHSKNKPVQLTCMRSRRYLSNRCGLLAVHVIFLTHTRPLSSPSRLMFFPSNSRFCDFSSSRHITLSPSSLNCSGSYSYD